MTFKQKYEYLFTDLTAFGKTHKATFTNNATAKDLREYAIERLASDIPIIKGIASRILADLNNCNNDLNSEIFI